MYMIVYFSKYSYQILRNGKKKLVENKENV
jgi:hypothetical protein